MTDQEWTASVDEAAAEMDPVDWRGDPVYRGDACQWFALCDNIATGTLAHPVLGPVPICDRCAAKVEAIR
jgi:hypothetical protein